jgi:hypothetical protein
MDDATIRWFGGILMASLLLVLSYLFSLQDGSGNVPVILLFAGLGLTFLLFVVGFAGFGESG